MLCKQMANTCDNVAGIFGSNETTFSTVPLHLHKMRRAAFGKMFSLAYIQRLEPTLKDLVDSTIGKVKERISAGEHVNLVHAYSALT
jgi:hypothetical protein